MFNLSKRYYIEEFENTKGVIIIRISKKDRQHSGQKKKVQKDKKRSTKHIFCSYKIKDRVIRTPLNTGGELRSSRRASSSCSTSDTHRVDLVKNPVINPEWGKDREVLTTSCPSFFDLRLSDYYVCPPIVSFKFFIWRYIICVFNIFVFPFLYWNNDFQILAGVLHLT